MSVLLKRYQKYKHSGVKWIGEIPEHWDVRKLKYSDYVIMGQSPSSDDYKYDNGLPFLQGNAEFTELHPVPLLYCNSANKIAQEQDILLSVRAPVGEVNIADRQYGIGRDLTAIRPNETHSKLLYYIALCLHDELNSIATGSTYTAVSADDVRNVYIPTTEYSEQNDIADFLDRKTDIIKESINKIVIQIDKLRELRQALISSAVTGKIDVRQEAAV